MEHSDDFQSDKDSIRKPLKYLTQQLMQCIRLALLLYVVTLVDIRIC